MPILRNCSLRRCRRRVHFVFIASISFVFPVNAQSQGLESLVKNVSDINFFFSCWNTRGQVEKKDDCMKGQNGFGVEVSYDVKKIRLGGTKSETIKWKLVRNDVTIGQQKQRDSVLIYEPSSEVTMSRYVLMELAVGWGQFSGFTSADPAFEIKGSVREVPSLTVYGTLSSDDSTSLLHRIGPYLGIRSGLIQLQNVQLLYTASASDLQTFSGSAQTFQLGFVTGLAVELIDSVNLFAERAWQIRRFPSIQWVSSGTNLVRSEFPTQLDFSGKTISIGVQLTIQ